MFDDMNAPARKIVRPGDVPDWAFRENYWSDVSRALREVFGIDQNEKVEELRKSVDKASHDTQTAFYHAEPFDVAADLAGRRGECVTAEEKQRYVERILESGRESLPETRELARAHPED